MSRPCAVTAADPRRTREIAAIHAMAKELALAEESRRAIILRFSKGRTDSSKHLDGAERGQVIEELKRLGAGKRGNRPKGARPHDAQETSRKARALWIALWHLGVIGDNSDDALAAFVRRQAGVDDPRFLRPADAHKVIDGLKAMASRETAKKGGGVRWSEHPDPRICVVFAQWRRLRELGALTLPPEADGHGLVNWLHFRVTSCLKSVEHLSAPEADRAIVKLGSWIRSVQARKPGGP